MPGGRASAQEAAVILGTSGACRRHPQSGASVSGQPQVCRMGERIAGALLWGQEGPLVRGAQSPSVRKLQRCGLWGSSALYTPGLSRRRQREV